MRNERGDINSDTTDIHRITRDYYEQLHVNKLGTVKEMDKFLETCILPRVNYEGIENLNS